MHTCSQHEQMLNRITSVYITACMRHSPMSGFSCFLRISLATSSVTFLGALRACDLSSSPLTPSCHQRFSVVYTVCLLIAKYSAMEATDHPSAWSCTMLWRRCAGSGVAFQRGKRRIWMEGGGPEANTVLIE